MIFSGYIAPTSYMDKVCNELRDFFIYIYIFYISVKNRREIYWRSTAVSLL